MHRLARTAVGCHHEERSQGLGRARLVEGVDPRGLIASCSLLDQRGGVGRAVYQRDMAWGLGAVGPCLWWRGCGLGGLAKHLDQGCRGSMGRGWLWKPRRLVAGMAERGCQAEALDLQILSVSPSFE